MTIEAMDRTVPAPPEFPVAWEQHGDVERFWERELMHVPQQATVLDDELMQLWIAEGFNAGCEAYDMPVRNAYRRINTYEYQSIAPVSHDPAELEELGRRCQEKLGAVFGRQIELWEAERLPEVKRYLAGWEAFDCSGASASEFLEHFEETLRRSARSWEIHFLTVFPVIFSMSLFDDLYQGLLGAQSAVEAFGLLQGLENHSTEADGALYGLSRRAASSPAVLSALERHDTADVEGALETSPEGQAFLADLHAYLDRYGRRQDGYISVSEPSWLEDPAVVISTLEDYATQPERDPKAGLAELAAERERLVADARHRLEGFPSEAVAQFEFLLDAAQQGSVMQENHNFWIDGQVVFSVRRVVLEAGRRLAGAGVIAGQGDVFHLTLDEIRGGLAGPSGDLSGAVAERTAELERFSKVQAPPVLGTFPPGPPPDDPLTRAIFKMFGAPVEQSAESTVINGLAGSPGVVRGRARVIHSLADAVRLEHGDVLVAPTTAPPWTALFGTAAAVVTDVGGILSHCAVVAREYMIPAVVGTKSATAALRDGQLVDVDGDQGLVRVVGEA